MVVNKEKGQGKFAGFSICIRIVANFKMLLPLLLENPAGIHKAPVCSRQRIISWTLKIWGSWTPYVLFHVILADQFKIAHKKKTLSTQHFEPITQYTINKWSQKQIMYTHNSRTLKHPQGVSGNVPVLDNKSTIVSVFSARITRFEF